MKNYFVLSCVISIFPLYSGNGVSILNKKRIVNVTHCGIEGTLQNADGAELVLANKAVLVEGDREISFAPGDIRDIATDSHRNISVKVPGGCLKSWSTNGDGTCHTYAIEAKTILIRKVTERIFITIKINNNVPRFKVIQQDRSCDLFESE